MIKKEDIEAAREKLKKTTEKTPKKTLQSEILKGAPLRKTAPIQKKVTNPIKESLSSRIKQFNGPVDETWEDTPDEVEKFEKEQNTSTPKPSSVLSNAQPQKDVDSSSQENTKVESKTGKQDNEASIRGLEMEIALLNQRVHSKDRKKVKKLLKEKKMRLDLLRNPLIEEKPKTPKLDSSRIKNLANKLKIRSNNLKPAENSSPSTTEKSTIIAKPDVKDSGLKNPKKSRPIIKDTNVQDGEILRKDPPISSPDEPEQPLIHSITDKKTRRKEIKTLETKSDPDKSAQIRALEAQIQRLEMELKNGKGNPLTIQAELTKRNKEIDQLKPKPLSVERKAKNSNLISSLPTIVNPSMNKTIEKKVILNKEKSTMTAEPDMKDSVLANPQKSNPILKDITVKSKDIQEKIRLQMPRKTPQLRRDPPESKPDEPEQPLIYKKDPITHKKSIGVDTTVKEPDRSVQIRAVEGQIRKLELQLKNGKADLSDIQEQLNARNKELDQLQAKPPSVEEKREISHSISAPKSETMASKIAVEKKIIDRTSETTARSTKDTIDVPLENPKSSKPYTEKPTLVKKNVVSTKTSLAQHYPDKSLTSLNPEEKAEVSIKNSLEQIQNVSEQTELEDPASKIGREPEIGKQDTSDTPLEQSKPSKPYKEVLADKPLQVNESVESTETLLPQHPSEKPFTPVQDEALINVTNNELRIPNATQADHSIKIENKSAMVVEPDLRVVDLKVKNEDPQLQAPYENFINAYQTKRDENKQNLRGQSKKNPSAPQPKHEKSFYETDINSINDKFKDYGNSLQEIKTNLINEYKNRRTESGFKRVRQKLNIFVGNIRKERSDQISDLAQQLYDLQNSTKHPLEKARELQTYLQTLNYNLRSENNTFRSRLLSITEQMEDAITKLIERNVNRPKP